MNEFEESRCALWELLLGNKVGSCHLKKNGGWFFLCAQLEGFGYNFGFISG
jgi:hypothetical protein